MVSLIDVPGDKRVRIVKIVGGYGLRRKLLSMGFHKDDILEMDSRSILRGPILIKDLTSKTSVALGRGIAQKIMVEIIGDRK
ncbi:MAG: FeoA domain-containing protein [Candidatus Aminicenantes bacterium]|nr:FeoA domain-containing protein [Candidatus Aminicenantes bacterium]